MGIAGPVARGLMHNATGTFLATTASRSGQWRERRIDRPWGTTFPLWIIKGKLGPSCHGFFGAPSQLGDQPRRAHGWESGAGPNLDPAGLGPAALPEGGPGCRRPYWVVAGGGVGASAPPNQPKSQA